MSDLSGLTALERLFAYGNDIGDVTGLAGMTSLTDLHLDHNQIDDNQISDIGPLRNLTSLENLYIGENRITDFAPLDGIAGLTTHGCNGQTPAS